MFPFAILLLLAQEHPAKAPQQSSQGDHMHRSFDDADAWAKSFDDPKRDAWQMPERIIGDLKLTSKSSVADIGAGTGYLAMRLARRAGRVYAVDIAPSMVAYLRTRAAKLGLKNVVAVQAEEDSPHLPAKVDLIVVLNTYHHIPAREAYFRTLSRQLNKGGRLAVIDWRPGSKMGPPEEFRFTPEKLTGELAKAGYKKAAQFDYLPEQNFLIFTR